MNVRVKKYLQIKKKFEYVNACKEIGYGNSKVGIFYTDYTEVEREPEMLYQSEFEIYVLILAVCLLQTFRSEFSNSCRNSLLSILHNFRVIRKTRLTIFVLI